MTSPYLPFARSGSFGIDVCDFSRDPAFESEPSPHPLQSVLLPLLTLILLGQRMADEIDGHPLQEGRVTRLDFLDRSHDHARHSRCLAC
jgi:hypothetical protein